MEPFLALSLNGQRVPANQPDGVITEMQSRPATVFRQPSLRSLPPDDIDANNERAQRNDGSAVDRLDPQFNNVGVRGPSRRRASLNLQVRPPTPGGSLQPITESYFLNMLPSPIYDPDVRPNPVEQEDLRPRFHNPQANNNGFVKFAAMIARRKANEYEYSPLELSETGQIRILRIEPAPSDAIVICSLIPWSLSEPYEALSYVWGNDEPTEEIKIRASNPNTKFKFPVISERSFYVRPNLLSALRNFRSLKKSVDLWIDALCIDQENDEEKEIQVAKMDEIYSSATNVLIWLGEPRTFSRDAFTCIRYV
jgi:hypothetical protein